MPHSIASLPFSMLAHIHHFTAYIFHLSFDVIYEVVTLPKYLVIFKHCKLSIYLCKNISMLFQIFSFLQNFSFFMPLQHSAKQRIRWEIVQFPEYIFRTPGWGWDGCRPHCTWVNINISTHVHHLLPNPNPPCIKNNCVVLKLRDFI